MRFNYTIHGIPPSNNKYIGRTNRWEYQAEKRRWEELIQYLCSPKPKKPIKIARVTLRYYFKTKVRHDPDNYAGKMILDGLVHAGILEDDSFSCIELVLQCGGYDSKNPRTEIEVLEHETGKENDR